MQLRFLLEERDVYRIGLWVVKTIRERTEEGKDIEGQEFEPYSTKPFALPLGAIPKKHWKTLKKYEKTGEVAYYETEAGKLWVRIRGGYRFLRGEVLGLPVDRVNLRRSGEMLSELQVIDIQQDGSGWQMRIGWVRPELAERAFYVEKRGRKFLGLTEAEQQTLQHRIEQMLTQRLELQLPGK